MSDAPFIENALPTEPPSPADSLLSDPQTLRLHAEELQVGRQTVETGRVRVSKTTHTRDQLVDEMLANHTVQVTTVPIGRLIETMPPVRDDGETMIIPIVEEQVIVEKRLVLKEELHIRRVLTTTRHQETVQLRYQEAHVTRNPVIPRGGESAAPHTIPPKLPTSEDK